MGQREEEGGGRGRERGGGMGKKRQRLPKRMALTGKTQPPVPEQANDFLAKQRPSAVHGQRASRP